MHDTPDQVHWHEPKAGENAGYGTFKRKSMPYDDFMEAEGVPIYRGIGVRRVQDLPLAAWNRLGGRRHAPAGHRSRPGPGVRGLSRRLGHGRHEPRPDRGGTLPVDLSSTPPCPVERQRR